MMKSLSNIAGKRPAMIYDNLYNAFVSMFPECADELNTYAKSADAEETDGMHIMFSFVVIPFILDLLNNDESDKLKRAFEYFERMASSDSADVTEVLEFTVIENLMSNGQTVYDKAKQYMVTNMIECCKRAEQFLQVGE